MEVILLERIRNLGFMGDVVNVKRGYARNFLLAQKKALRVSEENKLYFEQKKKEIEAKNLERKTEAQKVAASFKNKFISVIRSAGDTGQLYGSVAKRDVVIALNDIGLIISATQVVLNKPIKILGIHPITIELYPDVSCKINLNIAISTDAAEVQEKTGKVHGILIVEQAEEVKTKYDVSADSDKSLDSKKEEYSKKETSSKKEDSDKSDSKEEPKAEIAADDNSKDV